MPLFRFIVISDEEEHKRRWQSQQQLEPVASSSSALPSTAITGGHVNPATVSHQRLANVPSALLPQQPTPPASQPSTQEASADKEKTSGASKRENTNNNPVAKKKARGKDPSVSPPPSQTSSSAGDDISKAMRTMEAKTKTLITDVINVMMKADEVQQNIAETTSWKYLKGVPHYEAFLAAKEQLAEAKAKQSWVKILLISNFDFGSQGMFSLCSHH